MDRSSENKITQSYAESSRRNTENKALCISVTSLGIYQWPLVFRSRSIMVS